MQSWPTLMAYTAECGCSNASAALTLPILDALSSMPAWHQYVTQMHANGDLAAAAAAIAQPGCFSLLTSPHSLHVHAMHSKSSPESTFINAPPMQSQEFVDRMPSNFTLLIPTNPAFSAFLAALPPDERQQLLAVPDYLRSIIAYHSVSGLYRSQDLMDGMVLSTAARDAQVRLSIS